MGKVKKSCYLRSILRDIIRLFEFYVVHSARLKYRGGDLEESYNQANVQQGGLPFWSQTTSVQAFRTSDKREKAKYAKRCYALKEL